VYFSSAGDTVRISLSGTIGGAASDLGLAVTVLEAAKVVSEPERLPTGLLWAQAPASTETNMTVAATRFSSALAIRR
jgi:hypothetical protein